jgi:hypothetical protein
VGANEGTAVVNGWVRSFAGSNREEDALREARCTLGERLYPYACSGAGVTDHDPDTTSVSDVHALFSEMVSDHFLHGRFFGPMTRPGKALRLCEQPRISLDFSVTEEDRGIEGLTRDLTSRLELGGVNPPPTRHPASLWPA